MSEDSKSQSVTNTGVTAPGLLMLLLRKATIPIAVAVVTLVGQYFISRKLQERTKPILVKDVYSPDLSALPTEIQKQVPLIPIRYSLRHYSGGPAHNITVFIKSTSHIISTGIHFSEDSEAYTVADAGTNSITINVPQIRPNGYINFDFMKAVTNDITFTERSEDALILTPSAAQQQQQRNILYINLAIAVCVVAWVTIVSLAVAFIWRLKRWWLEYEGNSPDAIFRKRIMLFVIVIISYNVLVASLGFLAGFLPIPRISTDEIFSGVILYLLLTRYKLVVKWLESHTNGDTVERKDEPPKPKT
jgi:hypothetical protein